MNEKSNRTPRPGNVVRTAEVVHLDYQEFHNVSFLNCQMIYAGGRAPSLSACDFFDCEFIFEGAALNTARFIAGMLNNGGGLREFAMRSLGLTP